MFSVVQKYIEKDVGSDNIWLCILQLTYDNKKTILATDKNQSIPPYSQSDMSLLNLLKLSSFLFLTMSKQ